MNMAKWEDLNMHERHAFIKEAVKNGIRDIKSIRDKYNEYADGGHLSREEENNNLFESDKVLDRANRVYTNYDEAADFDLNPLWYSIRNFAYQNNIPHSGLSNCTLTATQWVDPSNPIKSAKTIVSNPKAHGYTPISIEDIVPGDLMISKNPKTGSFHTMLVESINKDGTPNLRYSTGGPNNDSLRTNISQAEYHRRDSSQGGNHTEDMFFRYNYPNELWLPEVTVTAPRIKSNGGNLFYDGGYGGDEDIKAIIASQWPATSKVDYALKPQEGFSQFVDENGNPRGTIETITPNQVATRWSPVYAKLGIPINKRPLLEEANRVDYRDYDREGNPIGEILMGKNYITTNQPGQNTIVYNPQHTKIEDIKQDLLHVMHDDPEYEKLYDIYMTEALNDMDFLYHDFSEGNQRAVEDMMNGAFSEPTDENIERGLNADSILQAQLDGYLREQFYPGTPEERVAAGYTGVPYTIKNPSLIKAINNIKGYLEQKALGGPLFNSRTPIESFQGGKPLPIVRR